MAEEPKQNKLFGALKRLFASGVVVRNVGGKKLKVADTDNLQYSKRTRDKYQRMHTLYSDYASGFNNIGFHAQIRII